MNLGELSFTSTSFFSQFSSKYEKAADFTASESSKEVKTGDLMTQPRLDRTLSNTINLY
jgi:hypothetical protein